MKMRFKVLRCTYGMGDMVSTDEFAVGELEFEVD
jgi:hypothetical protein